MRNQNESKVGILALTVLISIVVFTICASLAVGLHFGAAWGWTVAAIVAFGLLIYHYVMFKLAVTAASKDGHNPGRDFGRDDG